MIRVLGVVFLIFAAIVLVNYLWNLVGGSLSYASVSTDAGFYNGPSKGLSTVSFDIFDNGGDGLNYITQGYGHTAYAYLYRNNWHDGVDIAARYGAPIDSASDGTVLATGNQDNYCPRLGFGKYVAIRDDAHNLVLWYAHLGTIDVSPGQSIKRGATLGTVGATGYETGIHLHFSIFNAEGFSMTSRNGCGPDPTGKDLDPLLYLGKTY